MAITFDKLVTPSQSDDYRTVLPHKNIGIGIGAFGVVIGMIVLGLVHSAQPTISQQVERAPEGFWRSASDSTRWPWEHSSSASLSSSLGSWYASGSGSTASRLR